MTVDLLGGGVRDRQTCITIAIQLHAELTCEANVSSALALPSCPPAAPRPPPRTPLPRHLEVLIHDPASASVSIPPHSLRRFDHAPSSAVSPSPPSAALHSTPPTASTTTPASTAATAAATPSPLPLSPIKLASPHASTTLDSAWELACAVSGSPGSPGGLSSAAATAWWPTQPLGAGEEARGAQGGEAELGLKKRPSFAFAVAIPEAEEVPSPVLPLKGGGGGGGSASSYPPPSPPRYHQPPPPGWGVDGAAEHAWGSSGAPGATGSGDGGYGRVSPLASAEAEAEHALRELFRRQMWAYCQRTALLEYMGSAKMGISLFGFKLDRRFLASLQTVVVSSFVFAISRAVTVH
jgi:hypothetical protein